MSVKKPSGRIWTDIIDSFFNHVFIICQWKLYVVGNHEELTILSSLDVVRDVTNN